MNVKLLRQIQKIIREEPKRVDMGNWINTEAKPGRVDTPPCGTTACIAGFATILAKGNEELETFRERAKDVEDKAYSGVIDSVQVEARTALKITPAQAERLFFTASWPRKFGKAYQEARWAYDGVKAGKAVIGRINHFIKTKGRQ